MLTRTSRPLVVVASDLSLETRARCQDDNHQPGVYNPLMDQTFCHCGRIRYPGFVEQDRWPDRDARNRSHIPAGAQ